MFKINLSMQAFIVTVVGILFSLLATLTDNTWFTALSAFIALAGAYSQYRDTLPFELKFSGADWHQNGTDFDLVIPRKQHGKSNPTATVFKGEAPQYAEVVISIKTESNEAIVIEANSVFNGKVVIK